MARSVSPNGPVEFCYDFPRASTSAFPVPPSPRRPRSPHGHSGRRPSPPRHYHSDIDDDGADEDIDDVDYDAFGYPHIRAHHHAQQPHHTGNQWAHLYQSPYVFPSSCDSEMSALSSAVASHSHSHTQQGKKIRKPRPASLHSTDGASSLPPSSYSYSYTYSPPPHDIFDEPSSYSEDDEEEEEEEETANPESATSSSAPCSTSLRRQWAALSLRVRFSVFRAKRRIRMQTIARVTSL